MDAPAILIVDDEAPALMSLRRTLRAHGFENVLLCDDSREAAAMVRANAVSLMLLDLLMPHRSGEEVLEEVSKVDPDLPVIMITAEQEVKTAVRCMKLGATDYLLKPVEAGQVVATVERALEQSALCYENARLREQFFAGQLQKPEAFAGIISSDPVMLRLFGYLEAISRGSHPVLIMGETGTGKELMARALHRAGQRPGPFVAVNVAGTDDMVFSDTLFGHRAGAYTGATGPRPGMIEKASEGTLFLDEIGDLAEASQVKLLRLLQEREYYPLGSDSPRQLRARVVAATHQDPAQLRQDLYYRLRSYQVRVPPLHERLGDLGELIDHFLGLAAADLGKAVPSAPGELLEFLSRYSFPGNVRELQALLFEAAALHVEGPLPLAPFRAAVAAQGGARAGVHRDTDISFPYPLPALRQIEELAVAEALRRVQGNRATAARMLDVADLDACDAAVTAPVPGQSILRREDWKRLERDNLVAALEKANWKISGPGGAAELLDMKHTTLASRMKALGIEKPRGS